jgi:hypothetical protein
MRNALKDELGLMLQVETQKTKALFETTGREFQAQLKEAKSVIHKKIY